MKIMICGASGLVGQALVLKLGGTHELTLVGRDVSKLEKLFAAEYDFIAWEDLDVAIIAKHDFVINLAGENIGAKKWTAAQKEKIIESRVVATKTIATLCKQAGEDSPSIINASAIGIYGINDSGDRYTESASLTIQDHSFLRQVATQWENALLPAEHAKVPIVILRFAVILAKSGALEKMLPSFKMGLGAVLGDGRQYFPWVDLDDVVAAICFFLNNKNLTGTYNVVADEIVTQKIFARCLGEVLHKPCKLKMPGWVVRAMFGEMGDELLLHGVRVSNAKIKSVGFAFKYPELTASLMHILAR